MSILRHMSTQNISPQHISKESTSTTAAPVPQSTVEKSTQRITRRYIKGSRPARVTRISIEGANNDATDLSKPRLKQGVHISQADSEKEKSLIIASAHRAISIKHPGARAIIAKFDGQHCAVDISTEIDAPLDVLPTPKIKATMHHLNSCNYECRLS